HTRLQGDWSSDVCSSDLASKSATATEDRVSSQLSLKDCPQTTRSPSTLSLSIRLNKARCVRGTVKTITRSNNGIKTLLAVKGRPDRKSVVPSPRRQTTRTVFCR